HGEGVGGGDHQVVAGADGRLVLDVGQGVVDDRAETEGAVHAQPVGQGAGLGDDEQVVGRVAGDREVVPGIDLGVVVDVRGGGVVVVDGLEGAAEGGGAARAAVAGGDEVQEAGLLGKVDGLDPGERLDLDVLPGGRRGEVLVDLGAVGDEGGAVV